MHWNDERDHRLIEIMKSLRIPHSWLTIAAFRDTGDPKYLDQFSELIRTGASVPRKVLRPSAPLK
jgi:hypothetical protein